LGFWKYLKKANTLKGLTPTDVYYIRTPQDESIDAVRIKFYNKEGKFHQIETRYNLD
jgi:hypothetical protein